MFTSLLRGAGEGVWRRAPKAGGVLVIGVAAYFLATGTGQLLDAGAQPVEARARSDETPPPRAAAPRRAAPRRTSEIICSRNVFDYRRRPCVEAPVPASVPHESRPAVPPLCGGEVRLRGTVTSANRESSFAMVEAGGATRAYRVGDAVLGVGAVERIGWRLVLIDGPGEADCLLDLYDERQSVAGLRQSARWRRSGNMAMPMTGDAWTPRELLSKPEGEIKPSWID